MRRPNIKWANQAGFSMMDALVAVGVIAGGAALLANLFQNAQAELAQSTVKSDLMVARAYVHNFMSCQTTMSASAAVCNSPGPIAVFQADGQELLAKAGTTEVGKYQVRAVCDQGDITFQYKEPSAAPQTNYNNRGGGGSGGSSKQDKVSVKTSVKAETPAPSTDNTGWSSLTEVPVHCSSPMVVTYQMAFPNDAGPRCLWMADANDAAAPSVLLGCNAEGSANFGQPTTKTVAMSFSAGNNVRLIWNAAQNTLPPKNDAWLMWRNTANKTAVQKYMYLHRTNKANGTATLTGMMDDSAADVCKLGDLWSFADIGFILTFSTQDFVVENIEASCSYTPP